MKRQLGEYNTRAKTKKTVPASNQTSDNEQSEESKQNPWTLEEDAFMRSEVNEMKTVNWKVISKRMNKKFKGNKTSRSCRLRWKEILVPAPEKEWSENEELVLVMSCFYHSQDWDGIALLINNRKDVKEHFAEWIERIAKMAKAERGEEGKPLNKLQIMVGVLMLLEAISKEGCEFSEVTEIVQATGVSELNCFNLLNATIAGEQEWNRERLEAYVDTVMDKIQEQVEALGGDKSSELDDLIHPRTEPPRPRYYMFPITYMGQECYLYIPYSM